MKEKNILTEGKLLPTLIKFAIPFLLANLLQTLYGAVDLLVIGKFSDSAGVSAVATGSQIMQTITGIVLGLTTGGTVLIGQYFGAKKEKDVSETIGTILCIFSVMAVILTIIMLILTNSIVELVNTPKEAIAYTKQYVFICSCGILFIVGYNAVCGILRGLGDSKSPLIFVGIACVINVIGDLVLTGIFKMGVIGVSISTIAAQGISLIIACIFFKRGGLNFELKLKNIRINRNKAKNVLKLGMPIAMQDGLINISFLIITSIINIMGVTASASVGVVEKIIVFTMLPPISFGAAIAVMTAQNIGAGKEKRARQGLNIGIIASLIFGVICYLYAQWRPETITGLFTSDAEVVKMSALYFKSYSLDCVMVCFVFCMNSFFGGCGYSSFAMIHSMISTFGIRIPLAYILSKIAGITLYEIGFVSPLSTFVSIIMCVIYIRSGKWRVKNIESY